MPARKWKIYDLGDGKYRLVADDGEEILWPEQEGKIDNELRASILNQINAYLEEQLAQYTGKDKQDVYDALDPTENPTTGRWDKGQSEDWTKDISSQGGPPLGCGSTFGLPGWNIEGQGLAASMSQLPHSMIQDYHDRWEAANKGKGMDNPYAPYLSGYTDKVKHDMEVGIHESAPDYLDTTAGTPASPGPSAMPGCFREGVAPSLEAMKKSARDATKKLR